MIGDATIYCTLVGRDTVMVSRPAPWFSPTMVAQRPGSRVSSRRGSGISREPRWPVKYDQNH
jgi:hypothetical protein